MHRFSTLDQGTTLDDARKCTQLVRLVRRVHRQVRVLPVRDDAQADKVLPLAFHLFTCVFAAGIPEFARRDFVAWLAKFLFDYQFDRETVAVPTRNEWGVMTRE